MKQNRLTLSGGSGIIQEAESSPRKSLSGNASAVNWSEVQSESYKSRLSTLSSDEKVVDSILTRAKWALNNRDGLDTEEIYAVSLVDGREIARITNQHFAYGIVRTDDFTKKLNEADAKKGERVLLLHNHPRGLPPSLGDINSLLSTENTAGITIGHDGSIYYYSRPKYKINDYDAKIEGIRASDLELRGIELQEYIISALSERFGFIFRKL